MNGPERISSFTAAARAAGCVPVNLFGEGAITTDAGAGTITVRPEIAGSPAARTVHVAVKDGDRIVAETTGDGPTISLTVANPRLWSPDSPSLYALTTEVVADGKTTDRTTTAVGIRTFRFDPDRGFFLNDANLKLKGVCLHHDAGCLGAAVPAPVWADRLAKLKAMGCNAWP